LCALPTDQVRQVLAGRAEDVRADPRRARELEGRGRLYQARLCPAMGWSDGKYFGRVLSLQRCGPRSESFQRASQPYGVAVQDDEEAAPAPRKIVQLQYNGWPDHGIPSSADSILGLIKAALGCQPDRQKPIIVHCRWAADVTIWEMAAELWLNPMLGPHICYFSQCWLRSYGRVHRHRDVPLALAKQARQYVRKTGSVGVQHSNNDASFVGSETMLCMTSSAGGQGRGV